MSISKFESKKGETKKLRFLLKWDEPSIEEYTLLIGSPTSPLPRRRECQPCIARAAASRLALPGPGVWFKLVWQKEDYAVKDHTKSSKKALRERKVASY